MSPRRDGIAALFLVTLTVGALATVFGASEPGKSPKAVRVKYLPTGSIPRSWDSWEPVELTSQFGGVSAKFQTSRGEVRVSGFGSVIVEPRE